MWMLVPRLAQSFPFGKPLWNFGLRHLQGLYLRILLLRTITFFRISSGLTTSFVFNADKGCALFAFDDAGVARTGRILEDLYETKSGGPSRSARCIDFHDMGWLARRRRRCQCSTEVFSAIAD